MFFILSTIIDYPPNRIYSFIPETFKIRYNKKPVPQVRDATPQQMSREAASSDGPVLLLLTTVQRSRLLRKKLV